MRLFPDRIFSFVQGIRGGARKIEKRPSRFRPGLAGSRRGSIHFGRNVRRGCARKNDHVVYTASLVLR
jgi:hypothetical protein